MNTDIGFSYALTEARTVATNSENTDILFFHGSPNAPSVDFIVNGQFVPLVDNLSFGNFSPIYASLPADEEYQLNITLADDNDQIVKAYSLDLNGLGGQVITLSASGQIEGKPDFGLFQSDGISADLIPLMEIVISNVKEARDLGFQFYPNPAQDLIYLEGPAQDIELIDVNGKILQKWSNLREIRSELNLSPHSAGIYFLRIQHKDGHHTVKLVKQ
jgi:hypothetical protein